MYLSGVSLACGGFDVSQIADYLREIVVLVNCVEPFSATVKALVDTRIEAHVNYVDRSLNELLRVPKDEVLRREQYDLLEIGCFVYHRIRGI